jgi:predicted acyl esterase
VARRLPRRHAAQLRRRRESPLAADRRPWGHDDWLTHLVGERNLGFAGSGDGFGLFDRALAFYAAAVAGDDPPLPRVSAYMLGARHWLELETWPPPEAQAARLAVPATSFTHDPGAPTPSLGGRALRCNTAGGPGWGQYDQRGVAAHPGARLLELGRPPSRRLAGPVRASLRSGADGDEQADWVCTLCVRVADGAVLNLCEGIARAEEGADMVEVDLGNVCIELEPEASLALLVSGASYPRWEPLPRARSQRIADGSELHVHTWETG